MNRMTHQRCSGIKEGYWSPVDIGDLDRPSFCPHCGQALVWGQS